MIALGSGALVVLASTLVVQQLADDRRDGHSGSNLIKVVDGLGRPGPEQASLSRSQILEIARRENRSVADVERHIVAEHIKAQNAIKMMLGGHDPGVHIVPGSPADRIDADTVKNVPNRTIIDFAQLEKNVKLKKPGEFHGDPGIYVDAVNTEGTILRDSSMLGYHVTGAYLKGGGTAQAEELKRIEATSNGKSGWTGVTRVYSGIEGLDVVVLDEMDIAAGQMTVLIPANTLNTKVGGYPATLARLRSDDGSTMSDLHWVDGNDREYSLKIKAIDDGSVARLRALADSLVSVNR